MASSPGLRFAQLTAVGVALCLGAGLLGTPAHAQIPPAKPAPLLHKTKPAKRSVTLKPLAAGQPESVRSGPVSPYERAGAQRAQSGEPPPGHTVVRRQPAPASPQPN